MTNLERLKLRLALHQFELVKTAIDDWRKASLQARTVQANHDDGIAYLKDMLTAENRSSDRDY